MNLRKYGLPASCMVILAMLAGVLSAQPAPTLFKLLPAAQTGIAFANQLTESDTLNILRHSLHARHSQRSKIRLRNWGVFCGKATDAEGVNSELFSGVFIQKNLITSLRSRYSTFLYRLIISTLLRRSKKNSLTRLSRKRIFKVGQ